MSAEPADGLSPDGLDPDVPDPGVAGPDVSEPDLPDLGGADPDISEPDLPDPEGQGPEGFDPSGLDPGSFGPGGYGPEGLDPDGLGPGVAAAGLADPSGAPADQPGAQASPSGGQAGPSDGPAAGGTATSPGGFGARRTAGFWTGDGEAMAAGFLHRTDGPAGVGFAAGGVLDRLEPGPVLASFLADALNGGVPGGAVLGEPDDAEDCSDDGDTDSASSRPGVIGQRGGGQGAAALGESELVGVLCGARRMASLAAAQELDAIIELVRRRMAQARERKNPHLAEHVVDEIAAALTITRRSAARLLDIAGNLVRLPAVRSALALGIIDWQRAVVFADELTALGDADARAAADKVLPDAGEKTTAQLRRALRHAVKQIDPDAVRRRREKARKDASVQLWDEPSGNYALAGRELPHAQVIAADARLTAKAKWLQAHGVAGTLDQLRAAVFAAVLADQPLDSLLADLAAASADAASAGRESGSSPGSRPAGSAADPAKPGPTWPALTGSVNLTMPLAAWAGISEAPGEVGGHGPVDAEACRDLAAWLAEHGGTRWCLTLTDAAGRAVAHACARHGPGPGSSAPDAPAGPASPPGNGGPPRSTRPPPGTTGPPGHASHHGTAGQQDPRAGLLIQWLRTLRPTRLDTGECTHRDEVFVYRPSRRLRHLIEVRQRTCSAPGCRRSAQRCDVDHTIPYDQGGRTCSCNLGPTCKR